MHLCRAISDVRLGLQDFYLCEADLPITPCIICAGSFNPLHAAHVQLLKLGERRTGLPGIFELSVTNVDKPPLELIEIKNRMGQFAKLALPLVLTNRPRYLGKMEIFPRGSCFVMGADTFARVVDGRYYDPAESPLDRFESGGTRFIVAPRRLGDGRVLRPEEILQGIGGNGHQRWADLTTCISTDEFLIDLSSTDIRKGLAQALISGEDGK